MFEVSRFRMEMPGALLHAPLKIALAADLHDRPGGDVLARIGEYRPDLIAVAGDLMEGYRYPPEGGERASEAEEPKWRLRAVRLLYGVDRALGRLAAPRGDRDEANNNANAYAFLEQASRIAPTFYALGNHERYLPAACVVSIARTGAVLLDNASSAVALPCGVVSVGGLSTRADLDWLRAYSREEGFKLLLCHHPEYYPRCLRDAGADLILCGHAHGGQWRVCGRGIYAPGQGLLPRYTGGVYDGRMVVSRGLANTAHVPRFNNPAELVFIEVTG